MDDRAIIEMVELALRRAAPKCIGPDTPISSALLQVAEELARMLKEHYS